MVFFDAGQQLLSRLVTRIFRLTCDVSEIVIVEFSEMNIFFCMVELLAGKSTSRFKHHKHTV